MADEVALNGPGGGRMYKEDSTVLNTADKLEEQMGGKGLHVIGNTAIHAPAAGFCYCAIMVMEAATFATLTPDASAPITGTITAIPFPAGTWIYGKFTVLTLTSGSVLAYVGIL